MERLKIGEMTGNCWKWHNMAGMAEWLKMAGNDWKSLEIAENGWNDWKWLDMTGTAWNWLKIAGKAGNGWK